MSFAALWTKFENVLVIGTFATLLLIAAYLTVRTRFIQIRSLGDMFSMLVFGSKRTIVGADNKDMISPRAALLTAMSTSLGIGNIVAPVVAVQLGGEPALLGFIVAALLGSAVTFSEVAMAIRYRKVEPDGKIIGGASPYIEAAIGKKAAVVYAVSASLMLLSWSAKQSNSMASILEVRGVPVVASGMFLAVLIVATLLGGIRSVARVSKTVVPLMVPLYLAATLMVIIHYRTNLWPAILRVFGLVSTPEGLKLALGGAALASAFRWGLSEALFANEAGVGTAAIPHSHSRNVDPRTQGAIAMAAVYTNAIICTLSGLTLLVYPGVTDGLFGVQLLNSIIGSVAGSFGRGVLLAATLLFAYGTTLGNSYNSSAMLRYFVKDQRIIKVFFAIVGLTVFVASVSNPVIVWRIAPVAAVPVVLSNTFALFRLASKGELDDIVS